MHSPVKAQVYSKHIPLLCSILLISTALAVASWTDTTIHAVSSRALRSVTWGNDMFVAVGDGGTIVISADGIHWEQQASGVDTHLLSVHWGDGQYITVGYDNTVLASLDGHQWIKRETWVQTPHGTNPNFQSAAYGNATYVAGGDMTIYSQDGIDWQTAAGGDNYRKITCGANTFVGVGAHSVSVSENGRQWSEVHSDGIQAIQPQDMPGLTPTLPEPPQLHSAAYGNGMFLVVGNNPPVAVSQNGTEWSITDSTHLHQYFQDVAFNGEEFVIAGEKIYTTPDGTELKQISDNGPSRSIACNDSVCVILLEGALDIVVLKKTASAVENHGYTEARSDPAVRIHKGSVHVSLLGRNTKVAIHDIRGRAIAHYHTRDTEGGVRIPVKHLAPGMYLIRTADGENTFHTSVMIGAGK